MSKDHSERDSVPSNRQQTNSQTQAGAAAQLIVNIFLVSVDDKQWLVKPIAFHVDGNTAPMGLPHGDADDGGRVEVQMDAKKRSNAQGQGLTVLNEFNLTEVLGKAIGVAAKDQDIRKALSERR